MWVDEQTTSVDIAFDAKGQLAAPYHVNSDGTVGWKVAGVTPEAYQVGQHQCVA